MSKIPPKTRALVFVAISISVITAMVLYDYAMLRTYYYPQPNFLANTPYGAILLLLIPVSFGWLVVSTRDQVLKIVGLGVTVVLLLVWLVLVGNGMKIVGKELFNPASW